MPLIEQHRHGDRAIFGYVDHVHVTDLKIVRDRADGPLVSFQHFEAGTGAMGQQGAGPVSRKRGTFLNASASTFLPARVTACMRRGWIFADSAASSRSCSCSSRYSFIRNPIEPKFMP